MEISCPSCSRKHQSEEHADEFEFTCECGYSILMPSENALNPEAEQEPSISTQDQLFGIPGLGEEGEISQILNPTTFESLTPPEQLPEGMTYDPFEVQNVVLTPAEPLLISEPQAQAHAAPLEPKSQTIIEKSVRSSLGQILGTSFNIRIHGLSAEDFEKFKIKASEFCQFRPWLGDEVKKGNIFLEKMSPNLWISNLPEALAIELYLKTLEFGGSCEVSPTV